MSEININGYINIQSFMVTDLGLKGNELLVYALIYGFSQDGKSRFTGSLNYLAYWCGSTKRNVIYVLKKLVEKGYIERYEFDRNGILFAEYKAIIPSAEISPGVKKVHQGGEKISPNKLDNKLEKEKDISKDISQKKDEYKQMIDEYTEDKDLKESLYSWLSQRRSEKKFTLDALKRNLMNLKKLGSNDYERNEIVNQSIMNGWKGFFPTNKAKPTYRPPKEDIVPVYDSSNNPELSEEDMQYYWKLIQGESDDQQEKT